MKKSDRSSTSSGGGAPLDGPPSPPPTDFADIAPAGGLTGRYIVLLREDAAERGITALENRTGIHVATSHDEGISDAAELARSDGVVFTEIGAAVMTLDPDQLQSVQTLGVMSGEPDSAVIAVEPERYVSALQEIERQIAVEPPLTEFTPESDSSRLAEILDEMSDEDVVSDERADTITHYLQGYRDSTNVLIEQLLARRAAQTSSAIAPQLLTWNEAANTWGLQATRVAYSRLTGRGVRVAVLDTGFGPHGDFAGRNVRLASFIAGQTAADGHGHGTHCIGTACGPRVPRVAHRPRYGVATEAEIFAGKVLSNGGSGTDAGILAGINWAVANGCRVVSMSLGAPVGLGAPFSQVYEGVAQRALQRGTLIIAAAGNNRPNPVNHPANCPSIMAVGALDQQLRPASFSARGLNLNGGAVDIAAPGVNVYSSWPFAPMYRRLNGTSMATPHVAGIAALIAQATGAGGLGLWRRLLADARRLGFPRADVGAGLVQAR